MMNKRERDPSQMNPDYSISRYSSSNVVNTKSAWDNGQCSYQYSNNELTIITKL
jgi:hypothetical protein